MQGENRMPKWNVVGKWTAVAIFGAVMATPAFAGEAKVAVAANFTAAAKDIAAAYKAESGNDIALSFGSTGTLYNQISQSAPFDVFLAADDKRPEQAIKSGYGVKGTAFTYAVGKIVLYSTDAKLVDGEKTLKAGKFQKLAVADPKTAPYGTAAVETMKKLGVYDSLKSKIVQGNNIAQTFQFVSTGNAELGFVALSEVIEKKSGSRWIVPAKYYTPIRQDAVLLKTGEKNDAAKGFIKFLKGPKAAKIIEKYGYATGSSK